MPSRRGTRIDVEEVDEAATVLILHVPDCPLVDRARAILRRALARIELGVEVEERVGDYLSPTLVIDGLDVVTGRPPEAGPACRLDLPTELQILMALQGHHRPVTTVAHDERPTEPSVAAAPGHALDLDTDPPAPDASVR